MKNDIKWLLYKIIKIKKNTRSHKMSRTASALFFAFNLRTWLTWGGLFMRIHVNLIRLFLIPLGNLERIYFILFCIYIIQFDGFILYNLILLSLFFKEKELLAAIRKRLYVNYTQ